MVILIESTVDFKSSQIKIRPLSSPNRKGRRRHLDRHFFLESTSQPHGCSLLPSAGTLSIKKAQVTDSNEAPNAEAICTLPTGGELGSGPGVTAVSKILLCLGIVWVMDSKKGRHTLTHAGPGNLSSCTYNHSASVFPRTPDLMIMVVNHRTPQWTPHALLPPLI